jgi:hypothetical protein
MAVKIYPKGGAIIIENYPLAGDIQSINPTAFDWQVNQTSGIYTVRDKIENQSFVLGIYSAIQNEAGVAYASNAAIQSALNNFTGAISPSIVDEYGNKSPQLGDNIFKGVVISIPPEHHEIHCGDSYTAHFVADLSNGATKNYLVTVPDWGAVDPVDPGADQSIKLAHLVGQIACENETTFYFYEAPTVTANGNALSVLNRNRNSSNVDFLSIFEGATVSAVGTELEHFVVGSGKAAGGDINRSDEWVLKNNTTYLIRVVNNTTSNNYHTIRFQYYVHPGV